MVKLSDGRGVGEGGTSPLLRTLQVCARHFVVAEVRVDHAALGVVTACLSLVEIGCVDTCKPVKRVRLGGYTSTLVTETLAFRDERARGRKGARAPPRCSLGRLTLG